VQALNLGTEESAEAQALKQRLQKEPQALGDALFTQVPGLPGATTGRQPGQPQTVGDSIVAAAKTSNPLFATIAPTEPAAAEPSPEQSQEPMQPQSTEEAKAASGEAGGNEEMDEEAADGKVENTSKNQVNILEGLSAGGKMGTLRREAAQSLRTFIFGTITEGKKALSPKDIDRALRDKIGSRSQVQTLYAFWTKLDVDKSGMVDLKEFRAFVEAALKDITDGHSRVRGGFSMQAFKDGTPEENASFARQMCDRVGQVLLGRKATFVIEDVMRIIWPCSRTADLKTMKGWVNEFELTTWRTATPKQLAKEEFDALAAVFRFFDNDGSGSVTVDELIHSGLMDKDQARKYVMEVDGPDGDGELSILEFCELFCPTGFRAHNKAKVGTDDQGRRLVFDDRMNGWRLEEMDPGKAGLFST